MPDAQPSFIHNDKELLEVVFGIDPKILEYFRLLEHPYRGGPNFRYLYTTDLQEVIIQSMQLTVSRTAPFNVSGPYGNLLDSQPQFNVKLIALHKGVTKNWLIRKKRRSFGVKTARSYSQTLENVQNYFASVDQATTIPTLILDDGHFMDDECLSTLYSILNVEDNKIKFVQLIIASQEPLLDNIARTGELESRMRSIEIAQMTPDELKKMFQFRWQVAGGKAEYFPFEDNDVESFKIIFRYSKGSPREAIKVADEILKELVGLQIKKAKADIVETVAHKTLKKGKYKNNEKVK